MENCVSSMKMNAMMELVTMEVFVWTKLEDLNVVVQTALQEHDVKVT